ncbi:MAG: LamG-like jellyroll fold domain-containing protein, partial [Planctomycetota bacterium]
DCIEVFFSTLNAVSGHAEHYQYGFDFKEQKWLWDDMEGAGQLVPGYLQTASSLTADGYICEASIPYREITPLDWSVGSTIGFHPVFDDTDNGDRELQMSWTGRAAHDQSQGFGHMFLSSEPAIVPELSNKPSPADQATDVPRDVVLSWVPGIFANTHNVYFGTVFDDVNNGVGGITQDANSYDPGRLDFGTTYYWRVDEVNGPPDYFVHQGNVWSFTTEPVGYPIENITVTASSQAPNKGPENTVNGSGLDDSGLLHGKEGDDNMWLSDIAGPQPTWIEFQFDKVYKLHELWVWNSNEFLEAMVGFGFKDVTIEYSVNGADYTTLGTTHEFARAPGTPDYAHNTTVGFGGVAAKYVRLTANNNWGGLLNQYGLSEVRFLHVPVSAREPSPDSGATGVDPDVVLSWTPGREAVTHDVYVGTDEQAVIDGTAPATTVTDASYGPLSLDLDVTHYWKVNEVNEVEILTTWESNIWNFTTTEYLVVDDFESYNDVDPTDPESNRIFNVWIDGYEVPTNGALVGYDVPSFVELDNVHGGSQSMPLFYDNTAGATYSEAELTLSPPQDWSKHGVKALSLWFSGDPNNTAAQMYVKINGSKVVYDGDATNLTIQPWQPWNIDLAASGVDVTNVTKLAIGIDGNGAAGILYIDDIRLYPHDRQLATPTEPDPANLVGHWQLDGNSNDSSVNGRHGTAMGGPTFALGKIGQAINLDGVDDYVSITGYKGIAADRTDPANPVQPAFSIANWFKTTGNGEMVTWGSSDGTPVGGQYMTWRIDGGRLRTEHGNGNLRGNTYVNDGKWHHAVLVVNEGANLRVPATRLYVDGKQDTTFSGSDNIYNVTSEADVAIGRRAAQGDRYFPGSIDEVRIYDRVLTEEEIAWLAGRTKPFDKPF